MKKIIHYIAALLLITLAFPAQAACPTVCCGATGGIMDAPHESWEEGPDGDICTFFPPAYKCSVDKKCGICPSESERFSSCPDGCDSTVTPNKCMTACGNTVCELGEADSCPGDCPTSSEQVKTIKTTSQGVGCTVYCLLMAVFVGIATLAVVFLGVSYMSADSSIDKSKALRGMLYIVVGIIIIMAACPVINGIFGGTVLNVGSLGPCSCDCTVIMN